MELESLVRLLDERYGFKGLRYSLVSIEDDVYRLTVTNDGTDVGQFALKLSRLEGKELELTIKLLDQADEMLLIEFYKRHCNSVPWVVRECI